MMKKLLFVLAVLVVAIVAVILWYRRATSIRTVYATGFSKDRLLALPYGTSLKEARKALGEPLAVRVVSQSETWVYGLDASDAITKRKGVFIDEALIPLEPGPPVIAFDAAGRVQDISGDVLRFKVHGRTNQSIRHGSSRDQVRDALGAPPFMRTRMQLTSHVYSRSACDDCNYDEVIVTFDDSGRLVSKASRVIWD